MWNLVKDTLTQVDMTAWAEAALVVFFAVFVVQTILVLLGDKRLAQTHAENMLSDGREVGHE